MSAPSTVVYRAHRRMVLLSVLGAAVGAAFRGLHGAGGGLAIHVAADAAILFAWALLFLQTVADRVEVSPRGIGVRSGGFERWGSRSSASGRSARSGA